VTTVLRRRFGFVGRLRVLTAVLPAARAAHLWPALTLRWRRRRPGRRLPTPVGKGFDRSVIWQPRIELHVASPAMHVDARETWHHVTPGHRSVDVVRQLREMSTRLSSSLKLAWLKASGTGSRLDRGSAGHSRRAPVSGRPAVDGVTHASGQTAASRVQPSVAAQLLSATMPSCRVVRQNPLAVSSEWRRTLGRRRLSLQVSRPGARADRDGERPAAGEVRQRRPRPVAQVVWRDAARTSSGSPGTDRPAVSRTGAADVARTATEPRPDGVARDARTPHGRAAAVRLADFEPGLLDRLTDDVIRRVERRVRIERERRGL
jgi:hypothetical protein